MEERATTLGGALTIQSAPGQGTVLSLTLPLLKEVAL
jgi:signal transduction histidine kinase